MKNTLLAKENTTIIVFSKKANEAFIFALKNKNLMYGICKGNISNIKRECITAGFPQNFFVEDIETLGNKVVAVENVFSKKGFGAEQIFDQNYRLKFFEINLSHENDLLK